jgi:hypothetical protein
LPDEPSPSPDPSFTLDDVVDLTATPAADSESVPFDAYGALVRALVGLLLEGVDALVLRLQDGESAVAGAKPADDQVDEAYQMARYVLLGLAVETSEVARRTLLAAVQTSASVGRLALTPARPLAQITARLMQPLTRRIVPDVSEAIERWSELGRQEDAHSRLLAHNLANRVVDDVIALARTSPTVSELVDDQVAVLLPKLAADPQLDDLITALAGRYLQYLETHPDQADGLVRQLAGQYLRYLEHHPEEVDPLVERVAGNYLGYLDEQPTQVDALIRDRGNAYIDYLLEHPDQVQQLIQGQSLSMAQEMTDEVRERTVTADSVLEAMVRRVLRRMPREKLPEPPPEVRRRAEQPRLPEDYE